MVSGFDAGVVVCEDVEGLPEAFAQFTTVAFGAGEERPKEGGAAACCYAEQSCFLSVDMGLGRRKEERTLGSEDVDGVEFLAAD